MSSITCGNCKKTHSSVAEVKACFAGQTVPAAAPTVTRATEALVAEGHAVGVAILPKADVERPNRFGGKCSECGGWVKEGEGLLTNGRVGEQKFAVVHKGSCPAKDAAPAKRDLVDGIYVVDGDTSGEGESIFKVYHTVHGSNRQCVKRLSIDWDALNDPTRDKSEKIQAATFTYLGLAERCLPAAARRLSLEEAKQFGKIYGFCVKCGATLTDEKSIAAGIGPVCASKGW